MNPDPSVLNLSLSLVLVLLSALTAVLAARAGMPTSMVLAAAASVILAVTLVVTSARLAGLDLAADAPIAEAALVLRFIAVIMYVAALWEFLTQRRR
jgi:hypothetical protein